MLNSSKLYLLQMYIIIKNNNLQINVKVVLQDTTKNNNHHTRSVFDGRQREDRGGDGQQEHARESHLQVLIGAHRHREDTSIYSTHYHNTGPPHGPQEF